MGYVSDSDTAVAVANPGPGMLSREVIRCRPKELHLFEPNSEFQQVLQVSPFPSLIQNKLLQLKLFYLPDLKTNRVFTNARKRQRCCRRTSSSLLPSARRQTSI